MSKYIDDLQDYLDHMVDTYPEVSDYWHIMYYCALISECPGIKEEQLILEKMKKIAYKPNAHPILQYSMGSILKLYAEGEHIKTLEELKAKQHGTT